MSLLEQYIIRKEQVEKVPKPDTGDNSKKYKLKTIWENSVYVKESGSGQLPGFYHLIM